MGPVPVLAVLTALVAATPPNTTTHSPSPGVVFVCEHGSAKSVAAAAHFNRIAAERGLSIRAVARGIDPDPELAPAAVDGLRADGLIPTASVPQKLERADLESAVAVIAFNDLPVELAAGIAVQRWEVPPISTDYPSSRDAIVARIEPLVAAIANSSEHEQESAPAICDSPWHHQFDFWVGEWEVRTPDGRLAGVNRIEREYDGCVLHERYSTDRGFKGESLNGYSPGRKVWHQTWVDNQGTLLLLDGGLQGSSMVLEGETRAENGQVTKHRITWTPNANGSVRQHWESTDAKGEWSTAFDGLYTRK
jgi:protein-tyrosine-phosphatase